MYDICHLTDPRYNDKPEDVVRKRIKAKLALWEFLNESIDSILTAYQDPEELAREIISTSIWTLHPDFEGMELVEECKCILLTLKIPVPENYIAMFTESFTRIVIKKLQGQHRDRKE